MAEITPDEMAARLLSNNFGRTGPIAETLSDPIADTPMTVTLDELRPYELDPRLTRNPLYDEIKASIRERGLDAPPPITRRPGADHYIIRNGGNTRLAILRELWTETKDEQFFRISCLFRPWPERGDIVTLTGHLAENELHGGLSFIERALGVEKVRELYEQVDAISLSQSELARRLKADGYPVPQPHISRMQEAIQYLLPAIPNVLYGGLGRPQVEQLTSLRRAGAKIWEGREAGRAGNMDFASLFQDVLASFDGTTGGFSVQRVQDELVGQMADQLGINYDILAFDITASEKRWQPAGGEPVTGEPLSPQAETQSPLPTVQSAPSSAEADEVTAPATDNWQEAASTPTSDDDSQGDDDDDDDIAPAHEHVDPPAPVPDRLQSIQRLVADHLGETPESENIVTTFPVQSGGLFPISDVWYIEPNLDAPDRLRIHIAQYAREIASEAGLADAIAASGDGIGFVCVKDNSRPGMQTKEHFPRAVLALLHVLSAPYRLPSMPAGRVDTLHLASDIGLLLLGPGQAHSTAAHQAMRLSEDALIKLFRLLRLSRRLLEIERAFGDGEGNGDGGDAMARS